MDVTAYIKMTEYVDFALSDLVFLIWVCLSKLYSLNSIWILIDFCYADRE